MPGMLAGAQTASAVPAPTQRALAMQSASLPQGKAQRPACRLQRAQPHVPSSCWQAGDSGEGGKLAAVAVGYVVG
jgi:hypothetical protein